MAKKSKKQKKQIPQKFEQPKDVRPVYVYAPKKSDNSYKSHLKSVFLKQFQKYGVILKTCEAVGIDRATVGNWRKRDKEFNQAFVDVDSHVTEQVERMALHMALTEKNEALIIFLLKCRDKRYRSRSVIEVNVNYVQKITTAVISVIQEKLPSICPHCHQLIDFKNKLSEHLERIVREQQDSDELS